MTASLSTNPSDSILNSIKKVLGLAADYDAFDLDIVMHINTIIATLTQLGVGPATGFAISGVDQTWGDFLGVLADGKPDPRQLQVQTYIYLRVRFLFDPPDGRYSIASYEAQLKEFEWRINLQAEGAFDGVQPSSSF